MSGLRQVVRAAQAGSSYRADVSKIQDSHLRAGTPFRAIGSIEINFRGCKPTVVFEGGPLGIRLTGMRTAGPDKAPVFVGIEDRDPGTRGKGHLRPGVPITATLYLRRLVLDRAVPEMLVAVADAPFGLWRGLVFISPKIIDICMDSGDRIPGIDTTGLKS